MSEAQLDQLLAVLKALADASRLRIVGILADRECSGGELAELLGLRAATVSHHLTRLRELGLVSARAEGTRRLYRLDADALRAVQAALDPPHRLVELIPEARPDAYARKVLSSFLDGDRLLRIPASRRKRDVVLGWLAEHFEPGEEVPESEVNERLARHHWDTATLRRELVGGGWMTRGAGVYRRAQRDVP
ncbi:MAG TPA: metalloregulator ArsR/SmtB family transcription factor [Deltaproteobacteria bacterium]|nr:metalloregulator ArsR/SmtB family transcription factor [Deltaproteobacteria bacterium]